MSRAVKRVPAVLLGVGLPALEVARSLGRRGIEVIGVDWRRNWVARSRYLTRMVCPQREDHADMHAVLDRLAHELPERPFLMPLRDDHVLFVSRHRDTLGQQYRFLAPDPEVLEGIVSKRGLWDLCHEVVPMPATLFVDPRADLGAVASRVDYPCIIKPELSDDWSRMRPPMVAPEQKIIEIDSPNELLRVTSLLGDRHGDIVIQEPIPGPDSNLYYLVAYIDRSGKPLATFVGRKLRTCPPHFGNGTYVQSVHAPEVVKVGLRLLTKLRCRGSVGVEFKLDPRDGLFKLIEMNARFGLWDGFGAVCGVDFAYLAYADAVGLPRPSLNGYRAGVYWMQPDRDFWTALQYVRERELTLGGWARSILRCRNFAPAAWDDPMPWLALNSVFGRALFNAARGRLSGMVGAALGRGARHRNARSAGRT
jgi:D-aspartate ligase